MKSEACDVQWSQYKIARYSRPYTMSVNNTHTVSHHRVGRGISEGRGHPVGFSI